MATLGIPKTLRVSSLVLMFCISMVLVAGCGPSVLTMTYSPSSLVAASGSLSVTDFRYLPAENGIVDTNQIKNTAIGNIELSQSISSYFRNAAFQEFRLVGIKVNDKDRLLTGEISDFLIDDLGFSVDWTLTVRYILKNAQTNEVLYDSVKTVKKHTEKAALTFNNNLNEVIKANIEELLKDETFAKNIN